MNTYITARAPSSLFTQVSRRISSLFGCMFVRNKIYWYSSRLNPSFPPPTTAAASSGTAPTLVPFYLRRVSTPSASPSNPPPSYRTPARAPFPSPSFRYRHEPYPIHPGPSQSPTLQRSATAVMAAVTESIKVVLMRLNCRRYCRPLPPPTLRFLPCSFNDFAGVSTHPSLSVPLPFATSRSLDSSFTLCTTIVHRDPSRHRYGFRSFPSTYDFESRQLPSPCPFLLFLMYPSFLKLRLKLYNEYALYRVSRHNLLTIFLTSWNTWYSAKHLDVLECNFEAIPRRIYIGKQFLSRRYLRTRYWIIDHT